MAEELAQRSLALPLHTDLPNQELVPGYQFLHCYRNSASGGESLFADGFRVWVGAWMPPWCDASVLLGAPQAYP